MTFYSSTGPGSCGARFAAWNHHLMASVGTGSQNSLPFTAGLVLSLLPWVAYAAKQRQCWPHKCILEEWGGCIHPTWFYKGYLGTSCHSTPASMSGKILMVTQSRQEAMSVGKEVEWEVEGLLGQEGQGGWVGRASRAFPRLLLPALESFTNTWHSAGVEDKPQPLEISRSWEIMSLLPMELQGPFTKVPQIPRAFNEHETSLWCPYFFPPHTLSTTTTRSRWAGLSWCAKSIQPQPSMANTPYFHTWGSTSGSAVPLSEEMPIRFLCLSWGWGRSCWQSKSNLLPCRGSV